MVRATAITPEPIASTGHEEAAAGAVAGLTAGLLQLAMRFAGVPAPTELLADRFLQLLPVDVFLQLLGRLGGPIAARELAFAGGR